MELCTKYSLWPICIYINHRIHPASPTNLAIPNMVPHRFFSPWPVGIQAVSTQCGHVKCLDQGVRRPSGCRVSWVMGDHQSSPWPLNPKLWSFMTTGWDGGYPHDLGHPHIQDPQREQKQHDRVGLDAMSQNPGTLAILKVLVTWVNVYYYYPKFVHNNNT